MKHLFFILSSIIVFLILMLYLIEILSSDASFDIWKFVRSFVKSFPFLLLLTIIDYWFVSSLNTSKLFSHRIFLRIVTELLVIIFLAVFFVIVGNMLFADGRQMYNMMSGSFIQSVIAAILINIFTVIILEYIIQIRKNERLIQENLQVQYKELKNQINPHFLFNSLNILVSLINKDSQAAVKYTKRLSDVYRYVLTGSIDNLVRLEDEIKFISNYVEILKIRYGCGLEVCITVDNADFCRYIIPMALQVTVENAVKHNVVSEQKPLKIVIASDGRFLTVENTIYPRISVEPSTGVGIANLEKKYRIMSGRQIVIEKNQEKFIVKLPLL